MVDGIVLKASIGQNCRGSVTKYAGGEDGGGGGGSGEGGLEKEW